MCACACACVCVSVSDEITVLCRKKLFETMRVIFKTTVQPANLITFFISKGESESELANVCEMGRVRE